MGAACCRAICARIFACIYKGSERTRSPAAAERIEAFGGSGKSANTSAKQMRETSRQVWIWPFPQPHSPACIGGQRTEPYEQNTQQSPGFGLRRTPQASQSWKNRQASRGIGSVAAWPQCGQVIVLSRINDKIPSR